MYIYSIVKELTHSLLCPIFICLRTSKTSFTTILEGCKCLVSFLTILFPGNSLLRSTHIIEFEFFSTGIKSILTYLLEMILSLLFEDSILFHLRVVHRHRPVFIILDVAFFLISSFSHFFSDGSDTDLAHFLLLFLDSFVLFS
jgi:hypothetical protein